jgi:hypothetical protein
MTQAAAFRDASRAISIAKPTEFGRQCWRLAGLVQLGTVNKADAVDRLWCLTIGHGLVPALGEDRITLIIAEAFMGTEFTAVEKAA